MALSLFWRSQRKALWQRSSGISEGLEGTTLCKDLYQPFVHHVQQYVRLLLSLRDTLDEVGTKSNSGMGVWGRREAGLRLRGPR